MIRVERQQTFDRQEYTCPEVSPEVTLLQDQVELDFNMDGEVDFNSTFIEYEYEVDRAIEKIYETFYVVDIVLAVLISCFNAILIILVISGPKSRKQPFNIIVLSQAVCNLLAGLLACSFIAATRNQLKTPARFTEEALGINEPFCKFLGFMVEALMCTMTWFAMSVTIYRTALLTSTVNRVTTIVLAAAPWVIGPVSVAALKVPLNPDYVICEFYTKNEILVTYYIVVSLAIPGFFLLASSITCLVSTCGRNVRTRHLVLSTVAVCVIAGVVILFSVPFHIFVGRCLFELERCILAREISVSLQFCVALVIPVVVLIFPEVHTRKLDTV
ncbi:hypothetical protein ScPMuIL_005570 [Solemya velum]